MILKDWSYTRSAGIAVVLESWCYTRKTGTEVVHLAATGFQGIPSGVALSTNSPDNGDDSICTKKQQQGALIPMELRHLYQGSVGDGKLFRVHMGSLTLTCLYHATVT